MRKISECKSLHVPETKNLRVALPRDGAEDFNGNRSLIAVNSRTLRTQLDAARSPRGLAVYPPEVGFHPIKRKCQLMPFIQFAKNFWVSSEPAEWWAYIRMLTGAKRQKSMGLLPKKIPREEQCVRRALGQSPHKVGIPFRAERDVDPHLPPLFH